MTEVLGISVNRYSAGGALVTSSTYGEFQEDAAFKGILLEADPKKTTIYDLLITKQIFIQGGYFWSNGGNPGDMVEVSVVDKDDVLGLFGLFGLVPGVDVLELDKFVETMYLKPGGMDFSLVETSDIAQLMPGLYVRTKYVSVDNVKGWVSVLYKWFETDE